MMSQDRATLVELKARGRLHYVAEASISDILLCPICQEPLVEPVMDTLEHAFCLACATDCLKHSDTCPIGREPLSWETAPRMIRNMLDELCVRCVHHEGERCTFEGARETLLAHLKDNCLYELVSCKCAHQCQRSLLEEHLEEVCPLTEITCDECELLVARGAIETHLNTVGQCSVTTARRAKEREQEELKREQAKLEEILLRMNPREKDIIRLNVGGVHVDVTQRTLCVTEDSLLAKLFDPARNHKLNRDADGRVFLDRDPVAFREMLQWAQEAAHTKDSTEILIEKPSTRQEILDWGFQNVAYDDMTRKFSRYTAEIAYLKGNVSLLEKERKRMQLLIGPDRPVFPYEVEEYISNGESD